MKIRSMHRREKQSIETLLGGVHMLFLVDRNFKSAVVHTLKELKETMCKELKSEIVSPNRGYC